MKKIKYQGGLTKLITSKIGKKNKGRFSACVEEALAKIFTTGKKVAMKMDVVSFSSNKDFYDQLLSILSFVRYVGIPDLWSVYSDGTHTNEQVKILESIAFVKVKQTNWENNAALESACKEKLLPYAEVLIDYARTFPLGKKLFCYLNHKVQQQTLFLDADILFYKKASLFKSVLDEGSSGWYLPDNEWGNLDSRYKEANKEQLYQINSGFFRL
jgi:hypothetical protein